MSDEQNPEAREESRDDMPSGYARTDADGTPAGSMPQGDPGAPEPADQVAGAMPHAGARYALLRLSLMVTVGGVLYLLGLRGWVLLFVAVLVSGLLSFFLFIRQREAAARNLEAALAARNARRQHQTDAVSGAATDSARGPDAP